MVVVSLFRSMTTALVRRAVQSKRMSQRDNSAVVAVLGAIDEDNAAIREDVLIPPLSTLRMRRSWSSLGTAIVMEQNQRCLRKSSRAARGAEAMNSNGGMTMVGSRARGVTLSARSAAIRFEHRCRAGHG